MKAPNLLFGGKTIVLGGDFCQTLPVKKGAAKEELIAASIAESHLWWHFKICTLKENMRLLRPDLTSEKRQRSEAFAKWLLDVGNGEIGEPDKEDDQDISWIAISPDYLVSADETRLSQLIDFIYGDKTLKTSTAGALQEKAIVCLKNKTEYVVNAKILSDIEGQSRTYLSNDVAIPMGKETSETELLYPMEYLNTITFPGFPPHELELKVGSLITQSRKMSVTTIASLRIGQENCILEAKVYRKWISKSVPDMKELSFCYILIDRENNAIQANMDINNIEYFNPLLKPQTAYKFSYFIYYLGRILSISDVVPFGDAITTQKHRRKVDIENVDGNIIEFTMWDELAK
ncbi:DNA helicase [Tanacetum coccineum]|uniref:ATP-dependent DNA helicase n=1 Tax=Tanacetum coccineum TaxID=301880 RepID=A0ABQ5E255_9ASTR